MDKLLRPAWMVIDHAQVRENIRIILEGISPGTDFCLVVKDDSYGCGALEISKTAWDMGVRTYAVANMEEGLALRGVLPEARILLMGPTTPRALDEALKKRIDIPVWSLDMAKNISRRALQLGRKARVQVLVDTGLSRLGFYPGPEALEDVLDLSGLDGLEIGGAYTQFAKTETTDDDFSRLQISRMRGFIDDLKDRGLEIPLVHMNDSAATVKFRESDFDMVRSGALVAGSMTGRHIVKDDEDFGVRPVSSIKCLIARVAERPGGTNVSYDGTFVSDGPIKIATLPMGYGDGLPHGTHENFKVLIGGRLCRQVGVMNMDMTMVDVTGLDCKEGDEAVFLGRQGQEEICLDDWSAWVGKTPTFLHSMIRDRVPRIHINR